MQVVTTHPAAVPRLLTLPGVADAYTVLENTWTTLPESYQQRIYNHALGPVRREIQQAESPMPAVVFSVEAARVENAILLDCLTSEVALGEPEFRSTEQKSR